MIKKRCTGCLTEKPLEAFSKQKNGRHGRSSRCKKCRLEEGRIYRGNLDLPNDPKLTKICGDCKRDLPLARFYVSRGHAFGRTNQCKECLRPRRRAAYWADPEKARTKTKKWQDDNPEKYKRLRRNSHLFRSYGITLDEYEKRLVEQDGKCLICGTSDPGSGNDSFAVDHCHSRGDVRDLLCHPCNSGLGLFGDDPDRLLAAAMYLMRHQHTLERLLPGTEGQNGQNGE